MQAPPSYVGSICVPAALGTMRNRELRREMGNITDAAWASTWKGFIAGSIVERRSYDGDFAEHLPVGALYKDEGEMPVIRWQKYDHH